ncbi:MAG: DNA ligase D [Pseudomonadota bacterium]
MVSENHPELADYHRKRDPQRTPEPFGRLYIPATNRLFVVQQHAARHLHFDLRLELDGVLKSWAVPKGPSADPGDKRLAMQTEDHPLDYADFEGHIPPGNYGAGQVIVWDRGCYQALEPLQEGFAKGKLLFELQGHKLQGKWTLVRLKSKQSKNKEIDGQPNSGKEWLLIKEQDASVQVPDHLHRQAHSVLSGLTVKQLPKRAEVTRRLGRAAQQLSPGAATQSPAAHWRPMLASAGAAHNRPGWLWELKYDGYRVLIHKHAGAVKLLTRNGHNISERFPEICQVASHLPVEDFVMDGELVVNNQTGRPDFSLLQQRARQQSMHEIASNAITLPARYYGFDLLRLAGHDLRAVPLLARKKLLRRLLPPQSACIYSEHVLDCGNETFAAARELQIEGVVGKRSNSLYASGRNGEWIKVRQQRTGDFVVAGWSPAKSNAADIGALALAEYRGEQLTYIGHAGSGLSGQMRDALARLIKRLARKTSPLAAPPATRRTIHWLRPQLVVEVAYAEYTAHGHLRQPALVRLRPDKLASECTGTAELVAPVEAGDTSRPASSAGRRPADQVVATNPDKVLFPQPGFTKQHLVDYYRGIAPWLLPYLHDRPIVLTRFPDGVDGKSFYQRDAPDYVPDWIRREVLWTQDEDTEAPARAVRYFVLEDAEDLAYIANMGTLPIHVWHSRVDNLDAADWCVLDLDPKGAPFTDVMTLAQAIGTLCDEVELPAYLKTSGASGLHVLLPLHRQLNHTLSRNLAELLARVIVERYPDIATVTRRVQARQQKVYVDFMQNGHGKLIVAPYAVRAEAAGSVSMPIHWHELNKGLSNQRYHLGNALRRVRRAKDPLIGILSDQPDLARSLALLGEIVG